MLRIKSKKPETFKKNIKTDMKAGKPPDIAVEIADQIKRDSNSKRKDSK